IFEVLEYRLPNDVAARALNMLSHLEYQLDRLQIAGAAAVLARRAAGAARDAQQKAQALVNLGNVRFDQKNYSGALILYRRAFATVPGAQAKGKDEKPGSDRPLVLINIGNCLHEQGDYAGAEQAFQESIALAE